MILSKVKNYLMKVFQAIRRLNIHSKMKDHTNIMAYGGRHQIIC